MAWATHRLLPSIARGGDERVLVFGRTSATYYVAFELTMICLPRSELGLLVGRPIMQRP